MVPPVGLQTQGGDQGVGDAVGLIDDVVVPEAEHAEAPGAEPGVAGFVIGAVGVLAAVALDDHARVEAGEVGAGEQADLHGPGHGGFHGERILLITC